MSPTSQYEVQERAELLRDTARSLFPIVEGDIKPVSEVPHLSLEMLGVELQDDPENRFKIIGRLISIEGTYLAEASIDQQLSLPIFGSVQERTYSIRKYSSDLPQSLINGDENVFVGPLMLEGEYRPNGFAVWQLLPKSGDR